jgi:hypothetical protein
MIAQLQNGAQNLMHQCDKIVCVLFYNPSLFGRNRGNNGHFPPICTLVGSIKELGERILGSKRSQHGTAMTESLILDSYNVYSSPPRAFAQVTLQRYHKSISNDGLQVAHHVQPLQAAKPIRPKNITET